ncbi:CRISPR-associated helicase Cas3' [bacterium]|nr:CRISPR-associated helicase Cas3' [bacterium]
MTYEDFFEQAMTNTGSSGHRPYPYQVELATCDEWPELLNVPTGTGKTAAVVLAWLYRRRSDNQNTRWSTPRRLVYCLPMRTLVEQTRAECCRWLANLVANQQFGDGEIGVHLLMGGVDAEKWFLYPEREAILIGTQDMLLSRALNRGYSATRFQWPVDFGLLNSDCLWVFDEPQLMGTGVATSAQLAGLRRLLVTTDNCRTVWMSATLESEWLNTVDFTGQITEPALTLGKHVTGDDLNPSLPLHRRLSADKTLNELDAASANDMKAVAKAVLAKHVNGTQTLLIVNTVSRAKAACLAIENAKKREKKEHTHTLLAHSRFRSAERDALNAQLQDRETAVDRIIVATQVVEAGVDLSARTLITELAPWSSTVQRIGRCNRTGDDGPGQVFWIDLTDRQALPYSAEELALARRFLQQLEGQSVSPLSLTEFKQKNNIRLPFEHRHVLRRRDLLDLFDTAPDLSGNDIDVQRFVRGDDPDTDLSVFWRDLSDRDSKAAPTAERLKREPAAERRELCSVPIGDFRDFLKSKKDKPGVLAFVWDHIDDEWQRVRDADRDLRPGLTVLLPVTALSYSQKYGWDPTCTEPVTPLPPAQPQPEEATGSDSLSAIKTALTITEHTQHVCEELDELLESLKVTPFISEWSGRLRQAARWHDVGKAHAAFQTGMRNANAELAMDQLWAKSGSNGRLTHGRKHFRHELASALVTLQRGFPFEVAYLIAAHHGRVRLSIRAMPDEPSDDLQTPETLFALGVHDGDPLPKVDLAEGTTSPATTLDLSPMQLGGDASWTSRALQLLADVGPFRLAYLEALLIVADRRASAKEAARD